MPRKPVPPRNFTHRHARKTVEISFEEYTHNKNEILGKIYRRLFWLACLATTFGLIELVVYIVITAMYTTTVEFRRPVLGVALKSVYLVYWGMSAVLCAHGFHLHLKWRHFLKDGTHLVMHCRLFEVLGLGWFFAASWLLGGIFHVFGFVDVSIIGANMQNILYAVAISTLLLQLVLCPWFFKTIHSKTTQIDDIYCAEFLGKTKIKHINVEPLTDLNDIPSDSEHDVNDIHVDNGSSSSSEGGASESSHHDDDSNESHGDAEVLRGPAAVQFTIDPKKTLQKSAFWDLWKSTEVAGSFSCTFHNKPPTLAEVTKHLNARGFHVVSSNTSKDVVEVFLYAHSQADDSVPFLAEFIFVYPRRYFQTTFKCASKDVAGEFVKQFQLHQLMDTDD
ncbi:hypothetical protein H257_03512 [Aphanomyces astaci]|uniref:Beta-adaptin appendage C-terminal subdomain domain-containing protein n=2 Tax=Aphanomyces astaci TaxID=112090 RepID=W4GZA0_APHAT|nr:hypothetical protein H257_03512 [Aphanomyces astaci]ETV84253.1 hypothetical protein H257_03512 [Aphanomyces astaci]|eukprot:XP_009825945.1 hypothetical protein H257_03512 [Aphanomyces astaci]